MRCALCGCETDYGDWTTNEFCQQCEQEIADAFELETRLTRRYLRSVESSLSDDDEEDD